MIQTFFCRMYITYIPCIFFTLELPVHSAFGKQGVMILCNLIMRTIMSGLERKVGNRFLEAIQNVLAVRTELQSNTP